MDVFQIVDDALDGQPPDEDRLVVLCDQMETPTSREAYYMRWAARELLSRGSQGRGEVFSQIGMDGRPCRVDCTFCSFASSNSSWQGAYELEPELVVDYACQLDRAGIHMVSLMTTSEYDPGKYLEVVAMVREAVSPDLPLMANIWDFGPRYAEKLAAAGIDGVYNAPRLGEGEITRLPLNVRFETLDACRDAGLAITSGVEPLRPGLTSAQIAERIRQLAAYEPIMLAACSLVPVPGSAWEGHPTTPKVEREVVNSAIVLACGGRLAYANSNTTWVDAGTRPRGTQTVVADHLAQDFLDKKAALEDEGWQVFPGERRDAWFSGRKASGKMEA